MLIIIALTVMNLRGVRESGTLFAIPTYAFIASIALMVIWAGVRLASGADLQAVSAPYPVDAEKSFTGAALIFLIARAFSSGCTALTGVGHQQRGPGLSGKPKSDNAAKTLLMLGVIAISMFMGVTALAMITNVHVVDDPSQLVGAPASVTSRTVIAQVAAAVFGNVTILTWVVVVAAALILMLAASTAFNGFPVLGSILARDGYLPRQLHTRGDRLAFSTASSCCRCWRSADRGVRRRSQPKLIRLYIMGVLLVHHEPERHDPALVEAASHAAARRRGRQDAVNRVINSVGFVITGIVLVLVLVIQVHHGAWIVVVAGPLLFLLMKDPSALRGTFRTKLSAQDDSASPCRRGCTRSCSCPGASAGAAGAVLCPRDPARTRWRRWSSTSITPRPALIDDWDRRGLPVRLKVLDSPFREITRPLVDYVRDLRRDSPA